LLKKAFLVLAIFSILTSQSRPSRYEAKPTLALFSFSAEGMIDEDVALYTGFLRLELHQTRSFILVERIQINELLNEKNYDRMDCNTSDCAVEIGKLVGIKKVITGSFNLVADTCLIAGQLINVETKEPEVSVERTFIGELEDINPYIQIMAWEFAGLDAPKDILEIVEKPDEGTEEEKKSIWAKWIIKPVNYIANRIREFLFSSSSE
tara:strand:+ start:131 stop:754 length:624 start_codon:yes stop_codon:yes gene_type:complete